MDALPTIKASDLTKKATEFANDLIRQLKDFNEKHPRAKLTKEDEEYLDRTYGQKILGPTPDQWVSTFEVIFCSYIALQRVIIPG